MAENQSTTAPTPKVRIKTSLQSYKEAALIIMPQCCPYILIDLNFCKFSKINFALCYSLSGFPIKYLWISLSGAFWIITWLITCKIEFFFKEIYCQWHRTFWLACGWKAIFNFWQISHLKYMYFNFIFIHDLFPSLNILAFLLTVRKGTDIFYFSNIFEDSTKYHQIKQIIHLFSTVQPNYIIIWHSNTKYWPCSWLCQF